MPASKSIAVLSMRFNVRGKWCRWKSYIGRLSGSGLSAPQVYDNLSAATTGKAHLFHPISKTGTSLDAEIFRL
jgi:hypothetical protein